MMKYLSSLLVTVLCLSNAYGQISIGEWRTHLPYQYANLVMVTDDKVFCSSTGGLFSYGLQDNSIVTLSKTDGLSDNGVVAMNWSEEDEVAILAYEDANIDIIRGNTITNIPDVMKKQILGDKTVNSIYYLDQNAFLSCGFGIVVLNLTKNEISDTYTIGDNGDADKVYQVSSDGEYLFAATEKGLKKARADNPFLIDFNSWERIEELPFPFGEYSAVVSFSGKTITILQDPIGERDRIFYSSNTSWKELSSFYYGNCYSIMPYGDELIITTDDGVMILNPDLLTVKKFDMEDPRSAVFDPSGVLWVANYGKGLVRIEGQDEQKILPNGPYSRIAYRMAQAGGNVYSVSGGVSTTYNGVFRVSILQRFSDERWNSDIRTDTRDLVDLVIDPDDPNHVFAASWGYGLQEYKNFERLNIFNETNSSLQNQVPGSNVVRIGGLAYDADKNLWMTNSSVQNPISVMKRNREWKSFSVNGLLSPYPALGDIIITEDGYIWGIIPKGGGLFAMDINGTIDDESDDTYKLFDVLDENGNVITNEVFSFAKDLDGSIWVGTSTGIYVFYSPARLFTDGSIYAQDICVRRNDGTDYCDALLETEKITCIEVDGSNRKWIGTADGGAFLVSENGLEQIYTFNTSTSPILSNSINDICVEGISGEVFFGTDRGIISYRAGATEGAKNYDKVEVFPNPVRENYYGPIAIRGLVAQTTVKITDISGNIVNEIESNGGEAIWDGTDFKGRRVATGTYLLFLANQDATAAAVSKILFIH